jgi:hypothetical protein
VLDLFGRARLPHDFSREDRVRLLGEACEALLRGQLPSVEARLFLGGALNAWLQRGGSLERDFLRVTGKAGSHHTPCHVWRSVTSSKGATAEASLPSIGATIDEGANDDV